MHTTSSSRLHNKLILFLYPFPLMLAILVWNLLTWNNPDRQFIFSNPAQVASTFTHLVQNGELARNTIITLAEALLGFILGTVFGAIIGLSLWFSTTVAKISKPYITALGSIPIFALAPMIICWFGVGFMSKVALAFLSTIVVATVQSYQGAMAAEPKFLRLLQVVGATKEQVFRIVVFPSSMLWVVNAMKLNVGLALLGTLIGEFISSEAGLGYLIVKASGLYDIATVLSGIITLIVISLLLTATIERMEKWLLRWKFVK